jgi:predicted TIM-barrel fold metal-dependent hydrolase
MARSPSDATRFTATGPYASSSPSFSPNPPTSAQTGSQINFGSPAPQNETPQQKIARLRAAAALARSGGKESTYDSVVRVGRIWADRMHRFTAMGLIGLTVVSGMVAVAGITDMLLHNRRRRNEWMAEQRAKSARDLIEAVEARERGEATEDQLLLINRERAAREAEEAKKNSTREDGWVLKLEAHP